MGWSAGLGPHRCSPVCWSSAAWVSISGDSVVASRLGATTMKGKRLAISSPHGQAFAAVKELFQRAGVSTDDVQMTAAPFTAVADLMRTGQVDGATTLDPYTTQIAKAGIGSE